MCVAYCCGRRVATSLYLRHRVPSGRAGCRPLDPSKVRRRFIISACFGCASDAAQRTGGPSAVLFVRNGAMLHRCFVIVIVKFIRAYTQLHGKKTHTRHRTVKYSDTYNKNKILNKLTLTYHPAETTRFERCLQEPVLRIGAGYANLPQQPYNYY